MKVHNSSPKKDSKQEAPGRKPGNYAWYEIQDVVNYYPIFEAPKIVFQEIAYHSQFALEEGGLYCNKTTHVIPTSDLFLLGLLNSRVAWWYMNQVFPKMKDGALLLQGSFVEELPMPAVTEDLRAGIAEIVRQLVNGVRASDEGTDLDAEERLNTLTYEAYQLSAAERGILENSLPPRDPLLVARSN